MGTTSVREPEQTRIIRGFVGQFISESSLINFTSVDTLYQLKCESLGGLAKTVQVASPFLLSSD